MANKEISKLLFVHNSLPEYRISFWRELQKYINLEILVTNQNLERKIYGLNLETSGLQVHYLNKVCISKIEEFIKNVNAVILPSTDRLREWYISILLRILCKKYNISYYYWNEKWEPDKSVQPFKKKIKNSLHKLMIKSASSGCKSYIASGTKSKEYLKSIGAKESKIGVAYDSSLSPEPTEKINIREVYNIPKYSKIILYLGRLVSRKGCSLLIEAYKGINERKNVYLLICGSGPQESELRKVAKGFPNIIFCGKIQPDERKNYYEQSDVFVLPSIIEGGIIEAWGLTVNEALECGTPVISTDAVGATIDLIDNTVGQRIPTGDIAALRVALEKIINKNKYSENCKIRYEKFSVERMAKEFYKIIKINERK